ncbi:MAG: hypothetical protein ACOZBH_05545 [Patescibacteria group bacterium]
MKEFFITLVIGLLVFVLAGAWYFLFSSTNEIPQIEQSPIEISTPELVKLAQDIFKNKKDQGVDMMNGPCLTNQLVPGWVVDVAHDPRLPVDDLPENQCSAFREGRADHFIELDTDGNLIKIK